MSTTQTSDPKKSRRFLIALALLILAALAMRLAYWAAQEGSDPHLRHPLLDGAYYIDWAWSIFSGGEAQAGAFYLAPLYPHLLGLLFSLFGEGLLAVFLLQHVLSLATAAVLAVYARREVGPVAGLAAAGLFLGHHPLLFFASCPLGETLAIFLLSAALIVGHGRAFSTCAGGMLGGLAALTRPNLLLVPAIWAAVAFFRKRRRTAILILVGAVLVVLPVTLRNLVVSGHWVAISSNGGITAFHGNGPGARGTYTPQVGLSGLLDRQRGKATALARHRSGLPLDPVEADRWWGVQAFGTRLAAPGETTRLLARRVLLLLDNWEHGLDYHPMIDANPFRLTWRITGPGGLAPAEFALVPFAVILGLAVSGLALGGVRGSGGWRVWSALAAAAVTPIAFYVSSRYRLPFTALLVIPAGAGLSGLLQSKILIRRRLLAAAAGLACMTLSFSMPWHELKRVGLAAALSNRASAYQESK